MIPTILKDKKVEVMSGPSKYYRDDNMEYTITPSELMEMSFDCALKTVKVLNIKK